MRKIFLEPVETPTQPLPHFKYHLDTLGGREEAPVFQVGCVLSERSTQMSFLKFQSVFH